MQEITDMSGLGLTAIGALQVEAQRKILGFIKISGQKTRNEEI